MSQGDDDLDAGQDNSGSTGVFTLPEITITGSPSGSDSDAQDFDTTSPVLAAGIATDPMFPGPGGQPMGPIPDSTFQFPKIPGEGTGAASDTAADVTADTALAGEETLLGATPEAVPAAAPAAASGAVVAGVAVGGVVVGFAGTLAVGYAIDHAEELNQAPDPELQSLPGGAPLPAGPDLDAGAAPQSPASFPPSTPLPTAQDPVTGQPLYTPAGGEYSPAIDPTTGQPFQAPPSEQGDEQIEAAGNRTTNQNQVMQRLGLTRDQFNLAIHRIKSQVEGNPDMEFDVNTGDVYDQRSGEWVGNLRDP
jgi:hypothetical protein